MGEPEVTRAAGGTLEVALFQPMARMFGDRSVVRREPVLSRPSRRSRRCKSGCGEVRIRARSITSMRCPPGGPCCWTASPARRDVYDRLMCGPRRRLLAVRQQVEPVTDSGGLQPRALSLSLLSRVFVPAASQWARTSLGVCGGDRLCQPHISRDLHDPSREPRIASSRRTGS